MVVSCLVLVQHVAEEYRDPFVGHSTRNASRLVVGLVVWDKNGLRLLVENSRGLGRFDL